MRDRLAAPSHGLRVLVEAPLDGLQNVLVLPARNPPLLAGRAARLERTMLARLSPHTPELLPIPPVRGVVLQLLASRTAIDIFGAKIDKVLLAEATFRLCVRGHRLWQRDRNTCLLALEDLVAVEVAAIRHSFEFVGAEGLLRL